MVTKGKTRSSEHFLIINGWKGLKIQTVPKYNQNQLIEYGYTHSLSSDVC